MENEDFGGTYGFQGERREGRVSHRQKRDYRKLTADQLPMGEAQPNSFPPHPPPTPPPHRGDLKWPVP